MFSFFSNQRQYTVDKNGNVQSIACKTKCKDTVNVNQAAALQIVATDAMKPGTVYQSGKNYFQVTKDGKGFQQCIPKSNRSLQYRGLSGSTTICTSRAQPANDLVQQAINAANQGIGTYNQHLIAEAHDYMTTHPYDSYDSYLHSIGAQNNPLSQAEFNQIRHDMGLPQALGQAPMSVSTFNRDYQNSPVSRLLSPTLSGNLSIETQHSIQSVQDYILRNPVPAGNNERDIRQWITRFINGNMSQLNDILANGGSRRTNLATMLNNLANSPNRQSIWNRPQMLRAIIQLAVAPINRNIVNGQYTALQQSVQDTSRPFRYTLNLNPGTTSFSSFQSSNYNNPLTYFLEPLYNSNNSRQMEQHVQLAVSNISNWMTDNPIPLTSTQEQRNTWVRNFISSNLNSLESIAMDSSGYIQSGQRQQFVNMMSNLMDTTPYSMENTLNTINFADIVNTYGNGNTPDNRRMNYLFLERLVNGNLNAAPVNANLQNGPQKPPTRQPSLPRLPR